MLKLRKTLKLNSLKLKRSTDPTNTRLRFVGPSPSPAIFTEPPLIHHTENQPTKPLVADNKAKIS
jgi:hypothetical protein